MISLQHLTRIILLWNDWKLENFGKIQTFLGLKRQKIVRMHKTCLTSQFLRLSLARFFREGKYAISREYLAKKSWQSSFINLHNLQQTCYHQVGANDANASWYRLDDSKGTILEQIYCNLNVSDCVQDCFYTINHTTLDILHQLADIWTGSNTRCIMRNNYIVYSGSLMVMILGARILKTRSLSLTR